jgi:LPXTG-site transpeptidase (sortase) family protein
MTWQQFVGVLSRGARYALSLMSLTRTLLLPIAAIVASAALLACGGGDDPTPSPTSTEATSTSTSTATGTPRPTRTPPPAQTASAEAVEAIRSLGEFVSDHGYPEDASFARVRIPRLGVDARAASRYVGGDGVMANPQGPADVIWYDLSAWPGMGGAPGEGGNAIFSGHVDYNANVRYANVRYRGPGVFRELAGLSSGDIIEIDYAGETFRYAVVRNEQLGPNSDWGALWRTGTTEMVTLYTCGGEFDVNTHSYSDRVVVQAERIP